MLVGPLISCGKCLWEMGYHPARVTRHESCVVLDWQVDKIRCMHVRGAPAIGAAGAYGMALAAFDAAAADCDS